MSSSLADRLSRVAQRSTLHLTHRGRRTGKPYDVVIWFAVDGEHLLLSTMKRDRQWTRNVVARPDVELAIGDERFSGRVAEVTAPDEKRRVYEALAKKYWVMWIADLVLRLVGRDPVAMVTGRERGAFYRVEIGST